MPSRRMRFFVAAAALALAGNLMAVTGAAALPLDPNEPNDSIAAATVLGSLPQITLQNLTIDPAGDEDFFNYTAHDTGKLAVNLYLSNALGDLDLDVQDSGGNVLGASASTNDVESVTIPVVKGQHYYVHVFGFTGTETNVYTLEIENFPAPVPTSVTLDPADDSGPSNSDNNTFRTSQLHYFVNADLSEFASEGIAILTPVQAAGGVTPGAAVQVFDNGVSQGFAAVVVSSNNTIFDIHFDSDLTTFPIAGPNAAGPLGYQGFGNHITAAVLIIDGQASPASGRTQLSPTLNAISDNTAPLAPSTPDMLPSSDSGVNTDNITTIFEPAFQGTGEANAKVILRAGGLVVGEGVVGTDATDGVFGNGLGTWEITSEPLSTGTYNVTAQLEDLAGNTGPLSSALLVTIVPPSPPTSVVLEPADDSGPSNIDNVTFRTASVTYHVHADLSTLANAGIAILTPVQAAGGVTPGVAVQVFDNGVSQGFATVVASSNNTIFDISFDADLATFPQGGPNAAGPLGYQGYLNVVTAAVVIFDGLTSERTQQSPPLNEIADNTAPLAPSTPDLLPSSDSGINNDNITTVTAPAFQGTGEANARITLRADGLDVGEGVVGTDASDGVLGNGLGTWEITSEPLSTGTYSITANLEDLAGNIGPQSGALVVKVVPPFSSGLAGAFTTATDYPVGKFPHGIAIGDVNGDTYLDFVVANTGSNTVGVRLGTGTGTFGPMLTFASGGNKPITVALALLNGDAFLDIVVANSGSANVGVLLGNGDGTFGAPTTFVTGKTPMSVKTGFINGDGNVDVVTANAASNDVSILLGNGAGGLSAPSNVKTGGKAPQDLVIGDFNNDTKADLAVVNRQSNNVSFLAGNGAGGFGLPSLYAVGTSPTALAAADFNVDGKLDVAVSNLYSDNVSVLLGTGAGGPPQFLQQLLIHYPGGKSAVSIAIGDFNLDGIPDLALANQKVNTFSVLLGVGNGTFTEPFDFSVGDVRRKQPVSIGIGDFNGDGFADVAVVNAGTNDVSVLLRHTI